ncbi:PREDICTED: uncharacterized protein LOC107065198 [Polistes dominula]|uniref:Uncharacterized protein LOC107065198 n=1 Tax=Polistes dominula TaxID=743375 RepID=A0ABM1I1P8_POLDO|nr:PREDICTED: uncharacterized protein LOC107065198 [Polistes dominula]
MDNYCSPQYVDFTSNLEELSDDYFNKDHGSDKSEECVKIPEIKITLCDEKEYLSKKIVEETKESIITEEITDEIANEVAEKTAQEFTEEIIKETTKESMQLECTPNVVTSLETELDIIKNTPIKLIYSSCSSTQGSSKSKLVQKVTYNDVMQEAIEVLQNLVITPSNVFKKPMSTKNEPSKCLISQDDNNQIDCTSNKLSDEKIQMLSTSEREIYATPQKDMFDSDISPINILTQAEHEQKLDLNNSTQLLNVDTPSEINQSKLSMESSNSKKQSKKLSFQCRRQSLKIRRNSNKYISLAAAVLQFQNNTPERFRTKSIRKQKELKLGVSKDNQLKLKSVLLIKYLRIKMFLPRLETLSQEDLV